MVKEEFRMTAAKLSLPTVLKTNCSSIQQTINWHSAMLSSRHMSYICLDPWCCLCHHVFVCPNIPSLVCFPCVIFCPLCLSLHNLSLAVLFKSGSSTTQTWRRYQVPFQLLLACPDEQRADALCHGSLSCLGVAVKTVLNESATTPPALSWFCRMYAFDYVD